MSDTHKMKKEIMQTISNICFVCGFLSIIASILVWYAATNGLGPLWQNADQAHGERFGIFIGLWAPTFFILSQKFESWTRKE